MQTPWLSWLSRLSRQETEIITPAGLFLHLPSVDCLQADARCPSFETSPAHTSKPTSHSCRSQSQLQIPQAVIPCEGPAYAITCTHSKYFHKVETGGSNIQVSTTSATSAQHPAGKPRLPKDEYWADQHEQQDVEKAQRHSLEDQQVQQQDDEVILTMRNFLAKSRKDVQDSITAATTAWPPILQQPPSRHQLRPTQSDTCTCICHAAACDWMPVQWLLYDLLQLVSEDSIYAVTKGNDVAVANLMSFIRPLVQLQPGQPCSASSASDTPNAHCSSQHAMQQPAPGMMAAVALMCDLMLNVHDGSSLPDPPEYQPMISGATPVGPASAASVMTRRSSPRLERKPSVGHRNQEQTQKTPVSAAGATPAGAKGPSPPSCLESYLDGQQGALLQACALVTLLPVDLAKPARSKLAAIVASPLVKAAELQPRAQQGAPGKHSGAPLGTATPARPGCMQAAFQHTAVTLALEHAAGMFGTDMPALKAWLEGSGYTQKFCGVPWGGKALDDLAASLKASTQATAKAPCNQAARAPPRRTRKRPSAAADSKHAQTQMPPVHAKAAAAGEVPFGEMPCKPSASQAAPAIPVTRQAQPLAKHPLHPPSEHQQQQQQWQRSLSPSMVPGTAAGAAGQQQLVPDSSAQAPNQLQASHGPFYHPLCQNTLGTQGAAPAHVSFAAAFTGTGRSSQCPWTAPAAHARLAPQTAAGSTAAGCVGAPFTPGLCFCFTSGLEGWMNMRRPKKPHRYLSR